MPSKTYLHLRDDFTAGLAEISSAPSTPPPTMAETSESNTADGIATPNPSLHNILTIPLELFERIAELADPRDLPYLRLVNKECAARVLRTFKKMHFAKRAHLISSKDSLQGLLHLVRDDHFGRAIRTLVLCVDVLPQEQHPQFLQWHTYPASFREDTYKGHQNRKRAAGKYQDFLRTQQSFIAEEDDLCLLTTIFSYLKQLNNRVAIQIILKEYSKM